MRFGVLIIVGSLSIANAAALAAETPPAPDSPQAPEVEASPETASVHVIAENIETDGGEIWLALCDTSLSVEGCPYKKSVTATIGFVEVTFDDIPPGAYAVVGYHDDNGNGEFDSLLGVPREPYALSGAAGDMLVPTFEDAIVPIKAGPNDVIIQMRGIADW
jgi:uncharacterized protein (DUF2141 family)